MELGVGNIELERTKIRGWSWSWQLPTGREEGSMIIWGNIWKVRCGRWRAIDRTGQQSSWWVFERGWLTCLCPLPGRNHTWPARIHIGPRQNHFVSISRWNYDGQTPVVIRFGIRWSRLSCREVFHTLNLRREAPKITLFYSRNPNMRRGASIFTFVEGQKKHPKTHGKLFWL